MDLPQSQKDYEKENKKREEKRVGLLNSHLKEIQRNKAEAHSIDTHHDYDGSMIQSKTDKGLMTSSRHPESGEIHHVWHDEPKVVSDKAANRSRGNSQMRDDGKSIGETLDGLKNKASRNFEKQYGKLKTAKGATELKRRLSE